MGRKKSFFRLIRQVLKPPVAQNPQEQQQVAQNLEELQPRQVELQENALTWLLFNPGKGQCPAEEAEEDPGGLMAKKAGPEWEWGEDSTG
jgi:hypothetical protein